MEKPLIRQEGQTYVDKYGQLWKARKGDRLDLLWNKETGYGGWFNGKGLEVAT